jgi:hypothetical protein
MPSKMAAAADMHPPYHDLIHYTKKYGKSPQVKSTLAGDLTAPCLRVLPGAVGAIYPYARTLRKNPVHPVSPRISYLSESHNPGSGAVLYQQGRGVVTVMPPA